MNTNDDTYTLEYSEYSFMRGTYPFHLSLLRDTIRRNIQDMKYNHQEENKWQLVFVGSQEECLRALKDFHNGKVEQNKKSGNRNKQLLEEYQ